MRRALLTAVVVSIGLVLTGTDAAGQEEIAESLPFDVDTLWALDFDIDVEGFVPYYEEPQRNGIAINSIEYESEWGAADTEWQGGSGLHNVTIATVPEFDGECHYRLYVNRVPQGEFQNPETSVLIADPVPMHTWRRVRLNTGDTIRVTANTCSNGLIPEGDGYAWARARWSYLRVTQVE